MQINYMLDEGAFEPLQGHAADAGFDLRLPGNGDVVYVFSGQSAIIDTGVHFEIPEGYVGFIKSKSGLNVKKGLQAEGVIDAGYTGSVVVKLYNHGDSDVRFTSGDKITQIVFLPIPFVNLNKVDTFAETERGDKGFGSTGR
jgi:dUTP pyrophosphatase